MRNKLIIPALALAAAVSAAPAFAQAPQAAAPAQANAASAAIGAGTPIKDTAGGDVGTVVRADGQFYIVKTDKHEVRLPSTSFTAHQGHLIMAMTRDQLNAEVEKTLASANAKLVAGAAVSGSGGASVGTIDSIDDQFVTVKLTSGTLVKLPRAGVAPGANGAEIGMTAAELEAAAKGAAADPAAAETAEASEAQ